MHRGGHGFFQRWRWGDGVDRFTDRVFEVAWFWRLNPTAVMALNLERFDLYERQAERLAEQMHPSEE